MKSIDLSVIVPMFNEGPVIEHTIRAVSNELNSLLINWQLILVNDGSPDNSWTIVAEKAEANSHLIAIDLLRNYGQHNAVFCGLQHSSGDFVITMDDDMQNPPEEIVHLVNTILEGYDVVYGRFRTKQHAQYRRLGSQAISWVNQRIFHQPRDLVLTNFRILRRDVVERICAYQTSYPYITGLSLMFSSRRANVWVEHRPRPVGGSNYTLWRIATLVTRILFNYSAFPLRVVSVVGIGIALVSFLLGLYYLLRAVFVGINVPGWTTLIVLVSFFNGVLILILAMLGEYLVRLVNQVSSSKSYHIRQIVKKDD